MLQVLMAGGPDELRLLVYAVSIAASWILLAISEGLCLIDKTRTGCGVRRKDEDV